MNVLCTGRKSAQYMASKRLYHYLWDRCPGCELEMSKIDFQHFEPKMSDLSHKRAPFKRGPLNALTLE